MSAESPRRTCRGGGTVVRPQPVSDKTVMESVVDFIQDVVPQAYSNTQRSDDKEKIQWVRFENTDINDVRNNPDCNANSDNMAPVLLILGYTNGVQIWSIPASGDAVEVLSLRQGPVRSLRVLPHPEAVFGLNDTYATKRPLIALSDSSSAGQPFCSVKFVSLRTGDEVHNISFTGKYPVCDIKCNERVVIVAFQERVAAFDACQFRQKFWIVSCYPSPGPNPNPIALGTRWLAFADKKLVAVHQSCGGVTGDGGQSYAATVISAAKTITKGLTMFGETVASSLTGKSHHTTAKKEAPVHDANGYQPGVVTIVDIHGAGEGQITVQEDNEGEGLVAHFPAHATEPVTAMTFDPSGTLLLTADRLGHNFHVFRIMAHPWCCSLGAVHHLYTLHRGDTTAKVQDMCFTHDSRWVAVSTLRGTTHVFPITPYGGSVTVRTHTSPRMVNRASRYHRSAGLEDFEPSRSSGRHSPVQLSGSPGSSPGRPEQYRHLMHQNVMNNNMSNPRMPPYPHPTTVYPLVQIKQTLGIPGLGATGQSCAKKAPTPAASALECVCVAACFARSRGWVAGSPNVSRERAEDRRAMDSLYIINWMGNLVQYVLDPHPKSGVDKISDDTPLEVTETPRAQWSLNRLVSAPELKPPLPNNNPLILATEAIVSQRPSSGELVGLPNLVTRHESRESLSSDHSSSKDDGDDQWLSQVEIITHAGPHRRLWMGPQFSFKTFQSSQATVLSSNSSVLLSQSPETTLSATDILADEVDLQSLKIQPARSSPVAMPGAKVKRHSSGSDICPPSPGLLIEAGSYEQSPSLLEAYSSWPESNPPVRSGEVAEERLRETLADAMMECPAKEGGPNARHDLCYGSPDNLSTSSGSGSSATRDRGHSFDARSSPPHTIEHVLVFPSGNGSPDSN